MDYEISVLPLCHWSTVQSSDEHFFANLSLAMPVAGWTQGFRIMSWVFYYCDTRAQSSHKTFFHYFLSPGPSGRVQTLEFWIMNWVSYQCATCLQSSEKHIIVTMSLAVPVARLEPLIFILWVKYYTTVLP